MATWIVSASGYCGFYEHLCTSIRLNILFSLLEYKSLGVKLLGHTVGHSMLKFLKKYFIYFHKEGKGRRKRGEKYRLVAFYTPPTGDLAHNPGMCPDWESNWQPLGSQAGTQSTEPHQPGLYA